MLSKESLALGTMRSCIREIFEFGNARAAVVGRENVYDYSLGNPSVPAPAAVDEAIADILKELPSIAIHSYTSAPGANPTRDAIARDLNERFGTSYRKCSSTGINAACRDNCPRNHGTRDDCS